MDVFQNQERVRKECCEKIKQRTLEVRVHKGSQLVNLLSQKENTNHMTTEISSLNHKRKKKRRAGVCSRKSEEFMVCYAT